MSNVAHKDGTWCASSRIKLQTCPIRNQLNNQNTKMFSAHRFFWAFSFLVQSHCTHLFYCNVLRPVALRQRFYRPFPFYVWPRKNWKNGKTWITKLNFLTFLGCENHFYILVELVQFSPKEEDVMTSSISPLVEDLTRTWVGDESVSSLHLDRLHPHTSRLSPNWWLWRGSRVTWTWSIKVGIFIKWTMLMLEILKMMQKFSISDDHDI